MLNELKPTTQRDTQAMEQREDKPVGSSQSQFEAHPDPFDDLGDACVQATPDGLKKAGFNVIEPEPEPKIRKLTLQDIEGVVEAVEYRVLGTLTFCVVTTRNGYKVTGESACVRPEDFDRMLGQKYAYEMARDKLWALEGYLMKQRQYEQSAGLQ